MTITDIVSPLGFREADPLIFPSSFVRHQLSSHANWGSTLELLEITGLVPGRVEFDGRLVMEGLQFSVGSYTIAGLLDFCIFWKLWGANVEGMWFWELSKEGNRGTAGCWRWEVWKGGGWEKFGGGGRLWADGSWLGKAEGNLGYWGSWGGGGNPASGCLINLGGALTIGSTCP